MKRLIPLLFLCLSPLLHAQNANLSGLISDPAKAAVAGADVVLLNEDTGVKRAVKSNDEGVYSIVSLKPGSYQITVQANGFQAVSQTGVKLDVSQNARLDFALELGKTTDAITVHAEAGILQSADGSVATVVDRQFVGNIPLNGRSLQALIALTPGVVLTKTSLVSPGQFSVNGQRPNSNSFSVDGVSANFGITADGVIGQTGAGAIPGFSVSGGTNNLVSLDALQEFKVMTSTFAPEYGRTPGGQISIQTRSGTNQLHGSASNYFRNDKLDATDWFANANRLAKPALRQNDFGTVVGGPAIRNKVFFFFSYEGLRLRQPLAAITQTPSLASRQNAIPAMQPFLNAFPLPNGAETTLGMAFFNATYSNPTTLNATSIRVDHAVTSKLNTFARYNDSPSRTITRGINGGAISMRSPVEMNTRTLTAGATYTLAARVVNEFRGNFSSITAHQTNTLDDFGGAVPISDADYFPSTFIGSKNFSFNLTSVNIQKGGFAQHEQRLYNFTDSVSIIVGKHQLKIGADYRRTYLAFRPTSLNGNALFQGAAGALQGRISQGQIVVIGIPKDVTTPNLSLFVQDAWRASPRLTLTYGFRWDADFYPSEKNGRYPTAISGLENPLTMKIAPSGTRLWETRRNNIAPRVGFSYQVRQSSGHETILRGGFGVFYDMPYGFLLNSFATNWPGAVRKMLPANTQFPYTGETAVPSYTPTLPATPLTVAEPNFKLPLTYQWNVTVDQALGSKQTLTASYVGAAGRRLLRLEQLINPNPTFGTVNITRNAAISDYNALQAQFNRRLSSGLQALVSYTWAHSLDTASNDTSNFVPGAVINPAIDHASSDFDIRHSFNAAVTYTPHTPQLGRFGNAITHDWSIDGIVTGRTSSPVNIITTSDIVGLGVASISRPDLRAGVPLYLDDPNVAGGKRINRAAFVIPPLTARRQGNLGRNALHGFSLAQVDLALRREFRFTERWKLQFRGEWFNIFNHPNFADPSGSLGTDGVPNALFGISSSMLGRSLGAGAGSYGLNPLYQVGGARSVQVSAKLVF